MSQIKYCTSPDFLSGLQVTLSDYQTEISLNAYGITDQGSCSTFDLKKGEEITTIELGYAQDQVTSLKLVTNYESFL